MASVLRMPEVAANATEAVLSEWLVAENEAFSASDRVATVETEKAVVDVEAESDGVVIKALVPAGTQVAVGAPIAVVGAPGEQVADLGALLDALGVAVPPERAHTSDASGGTFDSPRRVSDDPEGGTANTQTDPASMTAAVLGRTFASPLARRLARDAGLAVAELQGTGPGGRIIRRDVEAALAASRPALTEAPAARPPSQEHADLPPPAGEYTDFPHSAMRRTIADRLAGSKQTAPHFYLRATVRVDKLLRLRKRLNADEGPRISVNDLVVKAAARASTLVPEMNVIWTSDAVRRFSAVDVSVAVATDGGLVTPVLRGVERMAVSTVAQTARELVERARVGRLRPEELEGGALTVTNLGMFGTEEFAAILNPPQSAILAVGAAAAGPVVDNGRLRVRTLIRVTLSVDHRAVDGVVAARWLRALVGVLEHPLRILA